MLEYDASVSEPEMMRSFTWLQTADGSTQQVEQEVAMFCPLICREMQTGTGSCKNYPISLPERVNPATLSLIFDYCRFHQVPGRSNKERKLFDEKFIRMDTKRLCELTSAADSLQLKPLVDLTSRALARIIEGKTPEEIRLTFNLPDDLTEEEKLEPIKNVIDDPRIRLLNRLYARKRNELKVKEKPNNEAEEEHVDERSVEDLLSFINGGNKDSKESKASKSKRKHRRKKDQVKNAAHENFVVSCQEVNSFSNMSQKSEANNGLLPSSSNSPRPCNGDETCNSKIGFDDADIDDGYDEIDPALREKIDREVEDFARRLNSDWPERMQEMLALGHDRRRPSISIKGSDSWRHHRRPDHSRK